MARAIAAHSGSDTPTPIADSDTSSARLAPSSNRPGRASRREELDLAVRSGDNLETPSTASGMAPRDRSFDLRTDLAERLALAFGPGDHIAEHVHVATHLNRAIEHEAGSPRVLAKANRQRTIAVVLQDAIRQLARISGFGDKTAVAGPRERRHFAIRLHRGHVRAAGRQDAVQLARHDVTGQPSLQRHDEDVCGSERLAE